MDSWKEWKKLTVDLSERIRKADGWKQIKLIAKWSDLMKKEPE
tara:strand:- start:45 stop:173 length:129 start_codon:yes stop_codon:yes gene_type:complete